MSATARLLLLRLVATVPLLALAGGVACSSSWPGGIQAVLARRGEGPLRVVDVPPGSAADRAGLREGDEIVSVDDESVEGSATRDTVTRLRGEVGSTVSLGVLRDGRRVVIRVERGPFGESFGRDRARPTKREPRESPEESDDSR